MENSSSTAVPQAQLTLFRSICIIVGIIVGAGIFESPPLIAANVSEGLKLSATSWLFIAWLLGGLFSLLGALCYAELATSYPTSGGDYVYLKRAFGPAYGFLFGWARLSLIQGASIGAMAYVVGDYATRLQPLGEHSGTVYALIACVVLTIVNVLGVTAGAVTQNILTSAKVLGLVAIVFVAFVHGPVAVAAPEAESSNGGGSFGLALILILWTYGGWNEIAYVSAEVKDARRNILRSLMLGVVGVTTIYLLVNAAFAYSLGFDGLRSSKAVAADVLQGAFGDVGARLIAALVIIAALGAVNGLIFTSPRVYYAMGRDHRLFAVLGQWSGRFGTPVAALILQGVIIVALIAAFGSRDGFETMVYLTAAAFWVFTFMTAISLFVLRERDWTSKTGYRVFGYPIVPVLFCFISAYMVNASATYKPKETLIAFLIILGGLPLYWLSRRLGPDEASVMEADKE